MFVCKQNMLKIDAALLVFYDAISWAKEELSRVIRTGSCSLGFVTDLATLAIQNPDNLLSIIKEVAILENSDPIFSATKPATAFKGKHLRGYWHKHHAQATNIWQNLSNEMIRDKTIERALSPDIGKHLTQATLDYLCRIIARDNYLMPSSEADLRVSG